MTRPRKPKIGDYVDVPFTQPSREPKPCNECDGCVECDCQPNRHVIGKGEA